MAGRCGEGKSYLDENRDKGQDGVDKAKVIWPRTENSGRMVWTG